MCRNAYPLTPPLPFTPGQELCGVVTAQGDGHGPTLGSRVMAVSGFMIGRGAFAEEALALADFCFEVPDGMSSEEAAAFLIPFHTAYSLPRGRVAREPGSPGRGSGALSAGG